MSEERKIERLEKILILIPLIILVAVLISICICPSIFFEIVKGFPILIIGLIAAYIALRQYLTARAKLKLDLFDKRYEIFEQTWKYLSIENPDERPVNFTNYFHQARFLFDADVELYMHEVKNKNDEWKKLKIQKESYNPPLDIDKQLGEIGEWFSSQLRDEVNKIFFPYLSFDKWK